MGTQIQASHGGCTLASEPERAPVEYAAGFIALLASVVSLRRRFRKADDADELLDEGLRGPRERMPSMP